MKRTMFFTLIFLLFREITCYNFNASRILLTRELILNVKEIEC